MMRVSTPFTALTVILACLVGSRLAMPADSAKFVQDTAGGILFSTRYPPDGARDAALGKVEVTDVGTVILSATRTAARLVITAKAASGVSVGRAETVVGLGDTPLYVSSPQGLRLITLHWASAVHTSGPTS